MKRTLAILAVLLAFAVGVAADKIVTYTLASSTVDELIEICWVYDAADEIDLTVRYDLVDTGAVVRERNKTLLFETLSTADKAKLNGLINSTILPGIDAAEGL